MSKMNKTALAVAWSVLLALAGCTDEADRTQREGAGQVIQQASPDADRITVERVKIVNDSAAYGGSRGVYIIRDRKTGKEFIGVSGVGISETGSHSAGKTTLTDER